MADSGTGGAEGRLTNRQIVQLGSAISSDNMRAIALGYLDLSKEVLRNIADKNRDDQEGFTRDVIEKWKNKPQNSDYNQVKRLASILYQAADEGGYIDPDKIQRIFQVSREDLGLSDAPLTGEELNELAGRLRPITARRSNIDMITWAENNKVKMEDLYTELKIDKLENKPIGVESSSVEDYKEELFPQISVGTGRESKGKRVLGKGEPGNGKTTFMKKVAWDWAKEIFVAFTLVFFVSLKLVEPGDPIENVIIQQNPELQGLKVTEQKLRDILETFGSHCLVILDGYDEHISGGKKPNADILKLLKGQKFLFCNVFLTSRPHSVADLEQHFSTIVSIQGFTEEHAREFASRVLVDQDKIDPIMEIQCLNAGEYISRGNAVFTCPLLLLFVCVLVNSDEIDLARKEVTLGEIYTRLVRCLYRKYTVRKGISFKQSEFVDVLKKVGFFADTYLFKRGFASRRLILEEVGEDAFDYGLLIGHEDFRVSATLRICDILISFPHRTIQEFLAALYFILEFDDGKDRESLNNDSPAKKSPLCLHFCLWFSGKHCTEEYFLIKNKEEICEGLENMFIEMKRQRELGLEKLLEGSINIHSVQTDELIQEFFQKLLSKCKRVKTLYLNKEDPIGLLMKLFCPLLPQLSFILLGFASVSDLPYSEELQICIGHDSVGRADELLACCKGLNRPLSLYFGLLEAKDLSKYVIANIKALHITVLNPSARHCLSALQDVPYSPHLTRLTLIEEEFDESFALALSKAVEVGNLPNIRQLCFEDCDLNGKLHLLFQKKWPSLTHLHLYKIRFSDSDIGFLLKTSELLPNLTSLKLFLGQKHDDLRMIESSHHFPCSDKVRFRFPQHIALFDMFESVFLNMTELWMYSMNKQEYKKLIAAINRGTLPQLRELGISMWKCVNENKMVDIFVESGNIAGRQYDLVEQGDTLDWLPSVNAQTLTHLTLNRFICSIFHLAMVMQSTVLTKLHKLDISHSSGMTGTLSILLCHSFPSLNSLILSDCGLNSEDLCSLAQAKWKGRLPELKHLDISLNNNIKGKLHCLFPRRVHWENLCSLNAKNDHSQYLYRHRIQPLNELEISESSLSYLFQPGNQCWKNIQEIYIHSELEHQNKLVDEIFGALERGLLPSLNYIECVRQTSHQLLLMWKQSIAHLLPSKVIDKVVKHMVEIYSALLTHSINYQHEQSQKIASGEAMHEHPFESVTFGEFVAEYLLVRRLKLATPMQSVHSEFKSAARRKRSVASTLEPVISSFDMSSVLSLVEDQHLTESQTKQLTNAVRSHLTTFSNHILHESRSDTRKRKEIFAKYGVEYSVS